MSGRTFLLQDYVTIRSGISGTQAITQDPALWLDLAGFSDVTLWIDVLEATPPGTGNLALAMQTAPSPDDSYFVALASALNFGAAPNYQASITPFIVRSAVSLNTNNLMRYLRWQLTPSTTGAWDITFRIRAVAQRSTIFVPPLIPGCVFWVRPDLGLTPTISGANYDVTTWNDSSGTGDSNKNLTAGATAPTLTAQDSNFNLQPTVQFSGVNNCYLVSGTWATALPNPASTCIIVGSRVSGTANMWLMDSSAGGAFGVGQTTGTAGQLTMYAGNNVSASSTPWTSSAAWLGEYNTTSSNLFFQSFTTPLVSLGSVGTNTLGSLVLANYSALNTPWDGTIAEVIFYNTILTANQKGKLRSYLNGRYALGIT